jgi:hypothetical protein
MDLFASLFGASGGAHKKEESNGIKGDRFRTQMAQTERSHAMKAKKIEADIVEHKKRAMEAKKNNQVEQAKLHLKRIMLLQNQLKTLHGYNTNNAVMAAQTESLQMAMENTQIMKEANAFQRGLMAEMGDVDDIQELREDIQETMGEAQEIIQAVSEPFDLGAIIPDLNDEALEAAMDQLDDEIDVDFQEQLLDIPSPAPAGSTTARPLKKPTSSSDLEAGLALLGD